MLPAAAAKERENERETNKRREESELGKRGEGERDECGNLPGGRGAAEVGSGTGTDHEARATPGGCGGSGCRLLV